MSRVTAKVAHEPDDLPDGQAGSLKICLAAHRGVTKFDEGEFALPQTFLDQQRRGL